MFAANEMESVLIILRRLSVEEVLRPVLVALIVIVLAARVFGALFRRMGQPSVVGEIAAGLMELIVINLGKELGVIPDSVFCMLTFLALVTTAMTTPLLL
jgi:Kef-type K+ transport system membrane component KefB